MAVKTSNSSQALPEAYNHSRKAWQVLILSFAVFCALVGLSCYGLQRFRSVARGTPEQPALLTVQSKSGVTLQQRGLSLRALVTEPTPLQQGDTVYVASTLPPGSAAELTLFDGTSVKLWPGTTLHLDTLQTTRFNNSQQMIQLRLRAGTIELTIPQRQSYEQAVYRLLMERPEDTETVAEDIVEMKGGHYLAKILEDTSPTTPVAQRELAPGTEFTVLEGQADMQSGRRSVEIGSDQRVVVSADGLSEPLPARWELLRDGDFTAFTQEEYNCTAVCESGAISSTTWIVGGSPVGAKVNGYFFIVPECVPPSKSGICPNVINAGEFIRRGSGGTPFKTYISQQIKADVTPFQQVNLKADVRILHQSMGKGGALGVECPLTITVMYINEIGTTSQEDYCYYAREDSDPGEPIGTESWESWITTRRIPYDGQWHHIDIDITQELPTLRSIEDLIISANGHDYTVEIANISLTAY